jgi:hypothetical protein
LANGHLFDNCSTSANVYIYQLEKNEFGSKHKTCVTYFQVSQYEKLAASDPNNAIDISPSTGEVISNQILDFETIKELHFQVRTKVAMKRTERLFDFTSNVLC